MIDVFDLYQDFEATANTFQGGFIPPQSTFMRFVNNISKRLWIRWVREAEKSQEAKDNLLPFLVSANVITEKQNSFYGLAPFPTDYGRFASAKILYSDTTTVPSREVNNGKCCNGEINTDEQRAEDYYDSVVEADVEMVDTQRWSACLKHLTKYPTFESPKMTQMNGVLKVAPREVSVVVLNYYKKPVTAVFGYTRVPGDLQTGAGGQIIYNKNQSKQLEWSETLKPEFLISLGEAFGIYTKDQFMAQFSAQEKTKQ